MADKKISVTVNPPWWMPVAQQQTVDLLLKDGASAFELPNYEQFRQSCANNASNRKIIAENVVSAVLDEFGTVNASGNMEMDAFRFAGDRKLKKEIRKAIQEYNTAKGTSIDFEDGNPAWVSRMNSHVVQPVVNGVVRPVARHVANFIRSHIR